MKDAGAIVLFTAWLKRVVPPARPMVRFGSSPISTAPNGTFAIVPEPSPSTSKLTVPPSLTVTEGDVVPEILKITLPNPYFVNEVKDAAFVKAPVRAAVT